MRLIRQDPSTGLLKLRLETPSDLWRIARLVRVGEQVGASTTRRDPEAPEETPAAAADPPSGLARRPRRGGRVPRVLPPRPGHRPDRRGTVRHRSPPHPRPRRGRRRGRAPQGGPLRRRASRSSRRGSRARASRACCSPPSTGGSRRSCGCAAGRSSRSPTFGRTIAGKRYGGGPGGEGPARLRGGDSSASSAARRATADLPSWSPGRIPQGDGRQGALGSGARRSARKVRLFSDERIRPGRRRRAPPQPGGRPRSCGAPSRPRRPISSSGSSPRSGRHARRGRARGGGSSGPQGGAVETLLVSESLLTEPSGDPGDGGGPLGPRPALRGPGRGGGRQAARGPRAHRRAASLRLGPAERERLARPSAPTGSPGRPRAAPRSAA